MKPKLCFLLLLTQCFSVAAMAYDAKIDGIYYDFLGTEATVTYGDNANYSNYSGDIVIPQSVVYNGIAYKVVGIGNRAFYQCDKLTSVTIQEGLRMINSNAFFKCSQLTSIIIPQGVESIGAGAFHSCSNLSTIQVPESVKAIGYDAFYGTTWLNSQANGLVYAGRVAYKYKGAMPENTSIELKEGTLGIAEHAFDGNYNLTNIIIPNSVSTIGSRAFCGCSGLASVTIPESVTDIGYEAFAGSAWYENQPDGLVYAGRVAYKYKGEMPENTEIDIADGTLGIAGDAFSDCRNLTSITLPEELTTIGEWAFEGCSGLTSITIPNGVNCINAHSFCRCYNLQNVILPKSVKRIMYQAFEDCGLMSILIPNSVTTIYASAFYGCERLTSIVVETDNIAYDSRNECNAIIETVSNKLIRGCCNTRIPENVIQIGSRAFEGCDFTSITIPNSVKIIDEAAFSGCNDMTSINIPKSVTYIGEGAFVSCNNLTSISVEDGNPVYDSRNECNAIIETASNTLIVGTSNTIIPDNITAIGEQAFRYIHITSINIPNSVTAIGRNAFADTPWLYNQPDGMVYAGKVAYQYKGEMPENTTIDIIDGTLGIADQAFLFCTGLTAITIPESVVSIGNSAFMECSSLTGIDIPESVGFIGQNTFMNCTNLTTVNLPNRLTRIGDSAFWSCKNLKSITFPTNVASIGDYAFAGCTSLSVVETEMNTPIAITEGVFSRETYAKATLYVPYESSTGYRTSDNWRRFGRIAEYNFVNAENQIITGGQSALIEVSVNASPLKNLVAFQMDLTLPEGIGIDKAGCSLSSRITDEEQELKIGKLENGAYRLTSSSLSLTPISGQDGTLLTLELTAESGSIGGQATISNIIFSTSESQKIIMSDETFDINVLYKVVYKVENEIFQTDEFAYNAQPTIADEPTREGYTFGGWSELPELMPNHDVEITGRFYLFGDVNTDEGVDVVDVVDIARFVVATPSTQFREKLADLNNDNTVNLGDAVVLINHIAGDQNLVKAHFASAWSVERNDVLSLTQSSNSLALNLSNGRDYTAFQFDLYVSNDAIVNQMMLSSERRQGHQLLYNKLETGHYRVAVLSTSNSTFQGDEGELLSFAVEGAPFAEASIRNILFFDTHANGYAFDDMSIDMVTGLHDVNINGNKDDVIYDLQGRKLSKVQRGVNIVNGKEIIKK